MPKSDQTQLGFDASGTKLLFNGKTVPRAKSVGFQVIFPANGKPGNYLTLFKNDQGIWWHYQFGTSSRCAFLTADEQNFRIVNQDFAVDSTYVYLLDKGGKRIQGSHGPSFHVIENEKYFYADQNQLYSISSYSGLKIWGDADTSTLRALPLYEVITDQFNIYSANGNAMEISQSYKYALMRREDRNNEYKIKQDAQEKFGDKYRQELFRRNCAYLRELYPDAFGWWCDDYPHQPQDFDGVSDGYHSSNGRWFYVSKSHPAMIHAAKPDSFEQLDADYAKDKGAVYWRGRRITNCDPSSFALEPSLGKLFGRDDSGLFYKGMRIDCDPQTYQHISAPETHGQIGYLAKDATKLFTIRVVNIGSVGTRIWQDWAIGSIRGSCAKTFQQLSTAWAIDSNYVYLNHQVLKRADAASFRLLFPGTQSPWAVDNKHVFNANRQSPVVKTLDKASFRALNQYWAVDATQVFCLASDRVTKEADVASFQVLDDTGRAQDANFFYSIGSKTPRQGRSVSEANP